jgi:hypothetical protein
MAQLLYIRNSQQIREAQANGEIDLYLRLDSVQEFGLTGYGHVAEIAANARLEAARGARAWIAETRDRARRPRRPSRCLTTHESRAVVALSDAFLALESDAEEEEVRASEGNAGRHDSLESEAPPEW